MHRKVPAWFGGSCAEKGLLVGHLAAQLTRSNDCQMTPDEVVGEARNRCDQENLISQLKSGVRALHAPVNTLVANWAYMTMASLAWSLKAWCALLLPVSSRWTVKHDEERRRLLTMEFRTFLSAFIEKAFPSECSMPAHATGRW